MSKRDKNTYVYLTREDSKSIVYLDDDIDDLDLDNSLVYIVVTIGLRIV